MPWELAPLLLFGVFLIVVLPLYLIALLRGRFEEHFPEDDGFEDEPWLVDEADPDL